MLAGKNSSRHGSTPLNGRDLDIADLASDSIVVRDLNGIISLWNKASEQLYGLTSDQAVGRSIDTLLETKHPFGLDALHDQLLRTGSWTGELYRVAADGRQLKLAVRLQLRRLKDGTPFEIIEWSHDAGSDEYVQLQAELASHRYRNLFHAMAASFWELDFSEVRKSIGGLLDSGVTDLRAYFRNNPEFIDDAIRRTRVVDINDKTLEMFGASSRDDILGDDLGWVWPAESRHVYAEALLAAAQRQDSYITETTLLGRDGRRVETLFTVCWPQDHKGAGNVLVGVIDITDRKRMEEDLRASELRYRNLFDFMPIAVWQMDGSRMQATIRDLVAQGETSLHAYAARTPEFRTVDHLEIVEANAQTLELFGASSKAEILGPLAKIWSNEDDAREVAHQRMQGASRVQSEVRLRAANGGELDALVTVAFPEALSDEAVNFVAAIDITERRKAQAELRDSEHRYRDLFQHMPIALLQLDMKPLFERLAELRAEGIDDLAGYVRTNAAFLDEVLQLPQIEEANIAALRLFGVDDGEALKGPIGWGWKERPDTVRRSLIARLTGLPSYSEETKINTRDGRVVDVLYAMSFPPELMERGINVVGFLDITERKRADAALKATEAKLQTVQADFAHAARVSTLGELAASIAHEVNQPLAAISAYGQASLRWLAKPEPDLAELASLSAMMVEDAKRASDIISRIRSMALKRDPDPTLLKLNEVVEEALLIVRHELLAHAVEVQASLDPTLPAVHGDRVQLQQVIVNLIINAVQAMETGRVARRVLSLVGRLDDEGRVSIAVTDSGPGIDPAHLDHLFTGFFTTKDDGMGMGLPICRSIIEAHGGFINATSSEDGASFVFTLPQAGLT